MKKQLKKAIQESFDFPEAAHKDEFLREHGIPAEEERRHFIPIPLRITAAAAACAFAIVLWNFAKDPAVKIKEPEGNNIITTDEGGADEIHTSANDTIITTTADSEYITISTTDEKVGFLLVVITIHLLENRFVIFLVLLHLTKLK